MAPVRAVGGAALVAAVYSAVALLPPGRGHQDAALTVGAATVLGASIVAAAAAVRATAAVHFVIWWLLLFLNLAAVAVEGTLFAPDASPPRTLPVTLLTLLAAASGVAAIVAVLFGATRPDPLPAVDRGALGWTLRILAAAAVYLALYFVIGGVNYAFVTRPYYEAHAGSLTVPDARTILVYEPVRGILIALSLVPIALALRVRRLAAAAVAGWLCFVVGGLVPLLPQASLPLYLRVASLWEIFGQNFLTGVACVYLFQSTLRTEARGRPILWRRA